jgi:hypothetical protein
VTTIAINQRKKYLGIPGIRYMVKVRRVSGGGLDLLSQFILDHVINKEDRVNVLLQSFGLPRGVIEDALTDLLESNRVSIDVLTGRLSKTPGRPERREYRLDPPFEVWQDECTGAILPMSMVRSYSKPISSDEVQLVWLHNQTSARDLLDLPAARALGSLISADPTITADQEGWVADGLVDPEKLGPLDLYVPVDHVEIDAKTTEFVSGKDLPPWLIRTWSFEMTTSEVGVQKPQGLNQNDNQIRAALELVESSNQRESPKVFDRARFKNLVDGWQSAFNASLGDTRELLRERNTFALDQLKIKLAESRSDFIESIVSSGHVRFESSSNHLREVWKTAESYVLIAQSKFTISDLEAVWSSTEGHNPKAVHLILIECSRRDVTADLDAWADSHTERALGGEVVLIRSEASVASGLCIADGREARFGSLKVLLAGEPVAIAQGRKVMQYLAASLTKDLNTQEAGGWWILRQLSPALINPIDLAAELGAIIKRFEILNQEFEGLIDEFSEIVSEPTESSVKEAANDEGSAEKEPEGESLLETAQLQLSKIELNAWEFHHAVFDELPKHRVLYAPLTRADLNWLYQETIDLAVAEKAHNLHIVLNLLCFHSAHARLVEFLQKIIDAGSAVRLTVSTCTEVENEEELKNAVGVLQRDVNRENARIEFTTREIPTGLILDGEIVALIWGDWFNALFQDGNQFGFVVESKELATQIKSVIDNSRTA